MDCLDCKNCKVVLSKGILKCKVKDPLDEAGSYSLWRRNDGEGKAFRLRAREVKTAHIEWRNIFSQGKNCPAFKLWEK